ncbi:MAG: carboxypeptidase regulatory-like domain-containing protein [Acidobacteriota bacterium]
MKKTFKLLALYVILSFLFGFLPLRTTNSIVYGQTNTGRISGTVTDTSGATLQGSLVKVTNDATGLSRTTKTDDNGFYVITNLLPGNYTVSVEHQGFKKAIQSNHTLVADGRLTVDVPLEPGAISESVLVTSVNSETINKTSGEVARVIDTEQVQNLALNGRNYLQLTTLIPGAPLLTDDPLALMTDLGVNQPINGNRGNTNMLTVDGGFNLDSGSNNSQINNVGIDFIQEVKIQTSNFSAEYGRTSGAAINVVTRSGGNQFHGSLFEFVRNNKFDANNFFNNARGRFTDNPTAKAPDVKVASTDPRLGKEVVSRPALRYNNYGFSFGGPIQRDKFFFFGGIEWKSIRRFTASTPRTLPTRAERLGDFSFRLRGADGIVGTADDGVIRDPQRTGTCSTTNRAACFPGNIIPASRITADGKAFATVYTAMEALAAAYTDTPTANNALYQQPNPFDVRQEIVRLDYRFNDSHSIYGRYIHDDYNLTAPFGTFIDSQLPTIPTNRRRPSFSYQVGHLWLINARLVNEAKVNTSWNGQRIPPVGDNWKRETYGFAFQQLFSGGRFDNGIPDTAINGFASWDGPSRSLLSPTTDIALSDTVSLNYQKHSIKTGGTYIRNRKDQNGRSRYTGQVTFNSSGNPNSTGNAFADALLGNFRTYTEFEDDPIGFFRFSQVDAFVSDSWKVSPRLSLEIGMRYQYGQPTYTQANNIVNFDPSLYDPAQAVRLNNNGTIVPNSGNRFNGLIRAGDGVPEKEIARVRNASGLGAVPAGAPRGLYDAQHIFMPRFGFAWSPTSDGKTAVRGGFGIFYDKPEGNLIFSQVNIPPFLTSASFENGNIGNIAGGTAGALAPFANMLAIDPNLELPYTMNWSISVQRELPGGVFGEVAYVSNLGRHLLRQPDINAPSFADLLANSQLPTAQRKATNALRPYKGFAAINFRLSDANSNYHALQLFGAKRKGDLTMTVSYTWSKSLADASGNGDGVDAGEEPFNRRANYGPTSFDRRHIFVTTYTYRIPFFHSWKGIGGALLSGWELSGITRFQTGQLLTVLGTTGIGNRRADYLGGDVKLFRFERTLDRWFNEEAFAPAAETRPGTSGRGIIVGPGRNLWDLSMRKRFGITEDIKLLVQADFFNAFNHTNFNNPNTSMPALVTTAGADPRQNIKTSSFGSITGAAPGRNIQLALKLTF